MSTTELVVDIQDIEFSLFEWLRVDQLQQYPKYADYDAETLKLLVTEVQIIPRCSPFDISEFR